MKKRTISILAISLMLSIPMGSTVVKATTLQQDNTNFETVGELTKTEKIELDKKLQLADQYIKSKNKVKSADKSTNVLKSADTNKIMLRSYNQSKTMYYPANKQQQGNWCGPAAAYNAIVGKIPAASGKISQRMLVDYLGCSPYEGSHGTPFPGSWKSTLDAFMPGNNYTPIKGNDYSDWRSKAKNCIIYAIDKGYPVIADTKQDPYGTKLHPNYKYVDDRGPGGNSTFHYVTITGYDDTPGNDRVLYSDSHPDFSGVYWTYTTNVAAVTKPFGLVW